MITPNRFVSLVSPSNARLWLPVCIVLKFLLLFFLINQDRPTTIPESIAVCSGDCDSYLSPIDGMVETGVYSSAFRMPGYGSLYFPFRLLFSKEIAVSLLIIFQTLIDAIAVYVLCILLFRITGKQTAFYATFLFYGIGVTVSCYNNWVMTESVTASAFIFGFYFLWKYFQKESPFYLLAAGLMFTWLYFLRPVNFPILIIVAYFLFFRSSSKYRMRTALAFLLPAIVLHSGWVIYNYQYGKKLYFLTETRYFNSNDRYVMANWEFCKTFGDFKAFTGYFDANGLTYFGQAQEYDQDDIHIPAEVYTRDFTEDSLLLVRSLFKEIRSTTNERNTDSLSQAISVRLEHYAESVRKNHPFLFYFKTPVNLTLRFVVQSGVHNLFYKPFTFLTPVQKTIKLFFIGIFATVSLLFFSGFVIFFRQIVRNDLLLLAYELAFYGIVIHAIVLRNVELRYLVPFYPLYVIGAAFVGVRLIEFLRGRRSEKGKRITNS